MSVVIPVESDLGVELWIWDHHTNEEHPTRKGVFGKRPLGFVPFPRMIYKARKHANGKVYVQMVEPSMADFTNVAQYQAACLQINAFNRSCYRIVNSDEELKKAKEEGWREGPQQALDYFEGLEQDIARAAAETNWAVARMGPVAQRELAEADAVADAQHVTDLRGRPKSKRGRPRRAIPVIPRAEA